MKMLLPCCLFALTAIVPPASVQSVSEDDVAFEMSHLERTYGIRLKSGKIEKTRSSAETGFHATMTFEFTKDLKDLKTGIRRGPMPYLRELLAGKAAVPEGESRQVVNGQLINGRVLRCYFFDDDGVVIGKLPPGKIDGELTGKEGDAFRITLTAPSALMSKTKKLSYREEISKK